MAKVGPRDTGDGPTAGQASPPASTKRGRRKERVGIQQRRQEAAARQRREPIVRWVAIAAVVLAAIGVVAWMALGRQAVGGLPEPEGGPSVAQDVGTLVGQPAAAFTLPDADGRDYTVTPGQGKPVVFVSHMGIT